MFAASIFLFTGSSTRKIIPCCISFAGLTGRAGQEKSNCSHQIFFDYFGRERLGLNEKVLGNIEKALTQSYTEWEHLIEISFLSDGKKEAYARILEMRKRVLGWV